MARLHSFWRVALFPFYSLYEVIAFLIIECILAGFSILILGSVKVGTLFAGYLGWMMVSASTTPTEALVDREQKSNVELALRSLRYKFQELGNVWIPDVPPLLVWRYNRVYVHDDGSKLKITGPKNIIEDIVSRAT